MAEADPSPQPSSRELHPGESIDGGGIRLDQRPDVADDYLCVGSFQERAGAVAEPRNVGAVDPASDRQAGSGGPERRSLSFIGCGRRLVWSQRADLLSISICALAN
jgi:hypothetical protein